MKRFECTTGGSNKFWVVAVTDRTLTTQWGRIGTTGQTKSKDFSSPEAADAEMTKLIRDKTSGGYLFVSELAVPPSAPRPVVPEPVLPEGDDSAKSETNPIEDERLTLLAILLEGLRGRRRMETIYALTRWSWTPGSYNQIGGVPAGVSASAWPTKDGQAMQFVLMLDLESVPNLAKKLALGDARALALFVANAADNAAYQPGTDDSRVLRLSTRELAALAGAPAACEPLALAGFSVTAIDVPKVIFDEDAPSGGNDDDDFVEDFDALSPRKRLARIRRAVHNLGARADGEPLWLQGPDHSGAFVLQFDDSFVPGLNLGDMGILYLFTDTAFWQCH